MRVVIQVKVGEMSMKTGYDIEQSIQKICEKFKVKQETQDKYIFWGYKYIVVLEGIEENIRTVIQLLKTDFKVKTLS